MRLSAKFIVRHSAIQELKAGFKVSKETLTQNLIATFFVDQYNLEHDLYARFYTRGFLVGDSLRVITLGSRFKTTSPIPNGLVIRKPGKRGTVRD